MFVFSVFNYGGFIHEFFREAITIIALLCIVLVSCIVGVSFFKKVDESKKVVFSYAWMIFFGVVTTYVEHSSLDVYVSGNTLMKIGLLGEVIILSLAVLLMLFHENDGLRLKLKIELEKSEHINIMLAENQKELRRLSNIKDRFLVNMSHELRTPLNAIIGTVTILKVDTFSKDIQRHLDVIYKSGANLMHKLDDILSIKILTKDTLELEESEFDLFHEIEELVSVYQDKAIEKGLYFNYENEIFPERRIYRSDKNKFLKAISVILDNAIKYTYEGSVTLEVKVSELYEGRDFVKVKVSDSGIGISKGQYGQLFDAFTQEDEDYSRSYGGAGVGLAIFDKLAHLLKAKTYFSSQEGVGSVFGFSMNLDKGHKEVDLGIKDKLDRLNILVVEDDEVNLFIARQLLEKVSAKIKVFEAANGVEALSVIDKVELDLIFMDLQMPIMDGYTSAEKIRALPNTNSRIPIVALTAHTQNSERLRCQEVGMNDFLSKPYTVKDLDKMIWRYTRVTA